MSRVRISILVGANFAEAKIQKVKATNKIFPKVKNTELKITEIENAKSQKIVSGRL